MEDLETQQPHESPEDYFARIFGISQDEQNKLKTALRASNGRLISFVHPFFEVHAFSDEGVVSDQRGQRTARFVDEKIFKALRNSSTDKLPILIWEEKRRIAQTRTHLQGLNSEKVISYLPTLTEEGNPDLAGNLGRKTAWRMVAEFLNSLGVKEVYLGGLYRTEYVGCVNHVIQGLVDEGVSVIEMPGLQYPGVTDLKPTHPQSPR